MVLQEDPETVAKWEQFLIKYRKTTTYQTKQDAWYRFNVFKANLVRAAYQNQNDQGTAEYGVTQFMDMTEEEFAETYLTLQHDEHNEWMGGLDQMDFLAKTEDAPESYDWREHGAVTPVKDQGQCGSCWAFSTIANIEGQYFLKNNKLESFSEQELVDCDKKSDQGCNGGLMQNAFVFLEETGFELESEYKYTARDGTCHAKEHTQEGKVASWKMVSRDAKEIAATLASTGPLSAAVNASWFQTYMGGIMDPFFCNPKKLDHGITLVGYGAEGGKDFWIIKNSWNTSWGEKGYVRLARGHGKCGINTNVCTATLA
jgi:C1A family cysteine protease